jgi:hypothetical protein
MRPRSFIRHVGFAALAVTGAALSACGGDSTTTGTAAPARVAQPGSLDELARQFLAAHAASDKKRLAELGSSMVPTTAELRSCLKPGPDSDAFLERYKAKDLAPDSKEVAALGASLFLPVEAKRTEVHVCDATTEEIAAYVPGTVAFDVFPGEMRRFAQKVAAPGRTWHIVTIVEPGQKLGTKYSCFTKVNGRFIAVGKPWRLIARDPEPANPAKPSDATIPADDSTPSDDGK